MRIVDSDAAGRLQECFALTSPRATRDYRDTPSRPTQARSLADARSYLDRRQGAGVTRTEAIRSLKRRISGTIYRAILADAQPHKSHQLRAV
jgi:hypothetical protein